MRVILAAIVLLALSLSPAMAHKRHHRHHFASTGSAGSVIGGRPVGCPYQFCGCSASLYLFGHIIPELNLAANWLRKFPRAFPAPGMAAARAHHVMVLVTQRAGNVWLVHDGNSGGHLTRLHERSIVGYVVVDPHGSASASRFGSRPSGVQHSTVDWLQSHVDSHRT